MGGITVTTREEMIEQGYITVREHPEDPNWKIYNYTDKAVYERVWNEHTLECRGLIEAHGEVIARPFAKFFNVGEYPEGELDLQERYWAYDKADGSLGILYEAPDGKYAIATRGSFASDQAVWATNWLREYYPDHIPAAGMTEMFEIVYPDNRIVLDYQGWEGLIYLGSSVINEKGVYYPADVSTPPGFRAVDLLNTDTLESLLTMEPRKNAEGLVLFSVSGSRMLKIKQEDYIKRHKLVSNFNERTVWNTFTNVLNMGEWQEYIAALPDEFQIEAEEIVEKYIKQMVEIAVKAGKYHQMIPLGLPRKEFADYAKSYEHPGLIFAIEDGKPIYPIIERMIRP